MAHLVAGALFSSMVLLTPSRSTPQGAPPEPKGSRILAIQANLGKDGDFDRTFKESQRAGSETQVLPQDWKTLEVAPGVFDPEVNVLAIANSYYPARKTPIHLSIRPVHTSQKVVPADLMDKPLDDPRTIERFKKLLDWVSTQLRDVELTSLTIGSEVDIYIWGDPERWKAWIAFYAAIAPYAKERFPGTLISCETTYASFSGEALKHVQELHRYSDAIGISYYPMKKALSAVESPEIVHTDFARVVASIPEKPIIFYQIGYPSSQDLGSSPRLQAEFIEAVFAAWDEYPDRILMLNFQWMHETPGFGLDQYARYYSYDTPEFRAFLGSLGMRSWSGEPKPAWRVLTEAAKVRGFGG